MMSLTALVRRAQIVRAIRAFFDERGFVEVETPVRIPAPAPEEHIDCPPCRDGGYLRASPELQMKKLLAAGMDRIYQIGPCFREGESGSRHSPEFTMLEWYRKNATYRDIAQDLKELLASLCDGEIRMTTLSVRDAYSRFAGWDPWVGDWDQDRFDFDMATKVEPAVREIGDGVFLVDYPPQAASLAKVSEKSRFRVDFAPPLGGLSPSSGGLSPSPSGGLSPSSGGLSPSSGGLSPSIAERWEFYWNGLELANCFTELCDADEQRRRFAAAKAARAALGEADYPIDEVFLETLPRLGSAAGVALGVDRLAMALTGASDISDVRAPA